MLFMKLILTPFFVLIITLTGRRWGSLVSGWLVGLPLTSAPVMLFIALEQGDIFASRAAQGTMTGTISVALFCLAYSWLSLRFKWQICLLVSWGVFFVSTYLQEPISLPLDVSFVGVLLLLAVVIAALPGDQQSGSITTPPGWEIAARVVVATLFVLVLTESAVLLGSRLSGLLTPFPLFASIVGAFTHAFQGAPAVRRVLRGVLAGSFAFSLFFLTISGLIVQVGAASAFGLALVVAMVVQWCSLWLLKWHGVAIVEGDGGRP